MGISEVPLGRAVVEEPLKAYMTSPRTKRAREEKVMTRRIPLTWLLGRLLLAVGNEEEEDELCRSSSSILLMTVVDLVVGFKSSTGIKVASVHTTNN